MKIEDYKYLVNEKEVTFNEWLIEFRKLFRTEYAYEEVKKDVLKKIENGIENGHNWIGRLQGLHLKIVRKKEENKEI